MANLRARQLDSAIKLLDSLKVRNKDATYKVYYYVKNNDTGKETEKNINIIANSEEEAVTAAKNELHGTLSTSYKVAEAFKIKDSKKVKDVAKNN